MPFYSLGILQHRSLPSFVNKFSQSLTPCSPVAEGEFPDAYCQLFGARFEQHLKTLSQKQKELESCFFQEGPPGSQQGPLEAVNSSEVSSHSTLSSSQPGTPHELQEGKDEVRVILLPNPENQPSSFAAPTQPPFRYVSRFLLPNSLDFMKI